MRLAHADSLKAELIRGRPRPYGPAPLDGPTFTTTGEAVAGAESAGSAIEVIPVSSAGTPTLFMMPADGEEGARFRRLARRLSGECSLSIVRPRGIWHNRSVTGIEDAAAQSVAVIRAAQAAGPYVIGGFCYGGVLAVETVRLLKEQGQAVLLVLFDAPTPGYPNFSTDLHVWIEFMISRARISWRTKSPGPILGYARRTLRMVAWFAVRSIGSRKTRSWKTGPLHWLWHQAQSDYFSFYTPRPLEVPILHFLAKDETDVLMKTSRHGWGKINDIATQWLPGDHDLFFLDKKNLPAIADTLLAWLKQNYTCGDTHQPPRRTLQSNEESAEAISGA